MSNLVYYPNALPTITIEEPTTTTIEPPTTITYTSTSTTYLQRIPISAICDCPIVQKSRTLLSEVVYGIISSIVINAVLVRIFLPIYL